MNGRSGIGSVALRPHLPVGLPFIKLLIVMMRRTLQLSYKRVIRDFVTCFCNEFHLL